MITLCMSISFYTGDTTAVFFSSMQFAAECAPDPFIEVCVELQGAADMIGNPFTVEVIILEVNSTATLLADYQLGLVIPNGCPNPLDDSDQDLESLSIEFNPGSDLLACADVTVLDDAIFEGDEVVVFMINQTFPFDVSIDSGTTTLVIQSDPTGIEYGKAFPSKTHRPKPGQMLGNLPGQLLEN